MEKKPFLTEAMAQEIIQDVPTPFHVYDEKGIRENARRINKAFSWNKGFKEYFAVKANPNPALISILREYGCGCDCSSSTELMIARALNVPGPEIMFSSNDTPAADFRLARELGAIVNFDDISHIPFFERVAGPIPETVSCRFNPGGLFRLANDIMDNPGDSKYGMTEEQLFEAFRMLRERGAKTFGIHAFLASNTVTNDYYPALARILFELAVRLQRETGAHVGFVNLSGGVGIPYRPEEEPVDMAAVGAQVRKVYDRLAMPNGLSPRLYMELGRYVTGPYGYLITTALHEKKTHKHYLGLDASACDLMRPALYGAYHHITVPGKEHIPADTLYDVTGSLCENNDKFAVDRLLPQVEMGDLVVIHDTGAHGRSMGYNYNGKLRCGELLLEEDGSVQLLRRPETPKDYFATLDHTGLFNDLD